MTDTMMLEEDLEGWLDAFMRSGRFASRSDVIREGLWLLDRRERSLQDLDASLKRGLADEEAGRVTPAKQVFDELRARYQAMVNDRPE